MMVYLDNAATTRTDPAVTAKILPYFSDHYGNASSLHYAGLDNRVAVDRVAAQVAKCLGCDKAEVYFTSGATESDNLAIFGVVAAQLMSTDGQRPHVITTKIEHDAVLEPCRELEKRGVAVTYLAPDSAGMITVEKLAQAIKPETVLVSIMYVNNEIGTILPIAEFGRLIAERNKNRESRIYFHTDATQALSCLPCRVNELGVDLLSLSGHKIYGPKGVGALYVRRGTPLQPLIYGGHQQANVRPGTYNVPGIVGLGQAVEALGDEAAVAAENARLRRIRDYLIDAITKNIAGAKLTGGRKQRAPGNASFVFTGLSGEDLVLALSERGIAVSTGSACSSGSLDPSHVLLAIGLEPELAHGALRVTLGKFNTPEDAEVLIKELTAVVAKLRQTNI